MLIFHLLFNALDKEGSFIKIVSDTQLGGLANEFENKKNSLEVFYMLERLVAPKKWKCNRINEENLTFRFK